MPLIIGIALAILVALAMHLAAFDRERSLYPVILIVVASYYLLFAAMAGGEGLPIEIAFFAAFGAAAIVGFRTSLWIVVVGLAGHGIFDFIRHAFLPGSGVPEWWPWFCMGFDVAAAAALAILLSMSRPPARGPKAANS
ncbi:hypothetical protein GCM10023264_24930 [Sphingomonas daechungensis]|uniref:Uncharacterized protein n=1 Tax=Sphingomonas daechungensis TaxID=1176646 RepID=A0ABX6T102_9SPHN|nr:hypothetical protein [Sphingomonas daechungensis]QNP43522.1 hypothetical protein H9L15_01700 [Sphingomonas daechungensis]